MWDDGQGAEAMGSYVGRWAGRGSDGEVCGAMGTARKRSEDIRGDGQGAKLMGSYVGRWAGRGSDGEVCGAMGRAW